MVMEKVCAVLVLIRGGAAPEVLTLSRGCAHSHYQSAVQHRSPLALRTRIFCVRSQRFGWKQQRVLLPSFFLAGAEISEWAASYIPFPLSL
jgi:hypothetical protein